MGEPTGRQANARTLSEDERDFLSRLAAHDERCALSRAEWKHFRGQHEQHTAKVETLERKTAELSAQLESFQRLGVQLDADLTAFEEAEARLFATKKTYEEVKTRTIILFETRQRDVAQLKAESEELVSSAAPVVAEAEACRVETAKLRAERERLEGLKKM
ncbi:hypothetical protein FGRMN_8551 [Fusarium graminum]|nr:hypothetical protein FGRMN_8551 [Fusarium graminum]